MEIDSEFFKGLEKTLDRFFPKGECRERSAALMLFTAAVQMHNKKIKEMKRMDIDQVYLELLGAWGEHPLDKEGVLDVIRTF